MRGGPVCYIGRFPFELKVFSISRGLFYGEVIVIFGDFRFNGSLLYGKDILWGRYLYGEISSIARFSF